MRLDFAVPQFAEFSNSYILFASLAMFDFEFPKRIKKCQIFINSGIEDRANVTQMNGCPVEGCTPI